MIERTPARCTAEGMKAFDVVNPLNKTIIDLVSGGLRAPIRIHIVMNMIVPNCKVI